jgi:2-polyprenyl-3-methyl-5-hydroxy-6-metoxy-1,4-benzoquinol methylase
MLPITPAFRPHSSLRNRHRVAEIMDEPDLAPATLDRALAAIARINALSMTPHRFWRRTRRLMRQRKLTTLRVLDLGCGDANVSLGLARMARRRGVRVCVTACDISEVAIERARRLASRHCLAAFSAFVADATVDDLGDGYDVVISSLFLHHLDDDDAVAVLRRLPMLCRYEAWMDDLNRSAWGHWLARWGCRIVTRSPVVRFDGPASVRSAWTPDEALALAHRAGLANVWVERRWPERFVLGWSRSSTEATEP